MPVSDDMARSRREPRGRQQQSLARRLSGLDPRRLLYLNEAVAAGSIRGGAERLDTSPSALSRQIIKLEAELGIALLERRGRGVRATDAGSLLVDHFLRQRSGLDDVVARIQDLRAMRHGSVALGCGEGFLSEVMGAPLRTFAEQHEGLRIELYVGSTADLVRRVAEDEADIALVYNQPRDPRLRSHAACPQPMRAIVRPGHALTRLDRPVRLDDLVGHELGFLPGSYGVRQVVLSAEHKRQIRLTPRLTSNSARALLRFAEEWGGVVVTTAFAVSREVADGRLIALEFSPDSVDISDVHLMTRRGRRLSVAAANLLRHIQATLEMISPR